MTAAGGLARGDIVPVAFPFTGLSGAKPRPAVIVGRVSGPDLILAFVSSRLAAPDLRAAYVLQPADPEFRLAGLKVPSLVRLDRLATIHHRLVRRRLGSLGSRTQRAVEAGLRHALQL